MRQHRKKVKSKKQGGGVVDEGKILFSSKLFQFYLNLPEIFCWLDTWKWETIDALGKLPSLLGKLQKKALPPPPGLMAIGTFFSPKKVLFSLIFLNAGEIRKEVFRRTKVRWEEGASIRIFLLTIIIINSKKERDMCGKMDYLKPNLFHFRLSGEWTTPHLTPTYAISTCNVCIVP